MPHPAGSGPNHTGGRHKDPSSRPPPQAPLGHLQPYGGVRHLFAALDLAGTSSTASQSPIKRADAVLEFCRYLRTLYPTETRIAIIVHVTTSPPHLTPKKCQRVPAPGGCCDNVPESPHSTPDQQLLASTVIGPVHRPAYFTPFTHRTTHHKN